YGLEIRCSIQLSYDPVLKETVCSSFARYRSRIARMTQLPLEGHRLRCNKKSPANAGDSWSFRIPKVN
ncbi:MAG: hypothetical protein ACOVNV_06755, partial [Pirellulaceae bacterium]